VADLVNGQPKTDLHTHRDSNPKGRRDSDLKKTILAIMSRYRIPELVWRDLEAARSHMTPKERFQASVILAELGLKASPKDLNVTNASSFVLHIEGLGGHRPPLIVNGETVSGALPHLPGPPPTEIEILKSLPAATVTLQERERDTRVTDEFARELEWIAEGGGAAKETGIF